MILVFRAYFFMFTTKQCYVTMHSKKGEAELEQDLISKKELLALTDISYGQLYRWKRKNLIPEEWFIRKSTFTGQETFFPRNKMLARIGKIKKMKNELSLDELADMFAPHLSDVTLNKADLLKRNIVSKMTLDYFVAQLGDADEFPFDQILYLYVLEKMLNTGEMSLEEGKSLLHTFQDHYHAFKGKRCTLIFVRKMGISAFLLVSTQSKVCFERNVKVVVRLNIANCIEELKLRLTNGGDPDEE